MHQIERRVRRRYIAHWSAIGMGLMLWLGCLAVEGSQAQDVPVQQGPTIDFNIPAQSLGSALNAFAVASGWQISSSSELTAGAQTSGLSGTYAPEQGLHTLLSGTGLTYRVDGAQMVTIERGVLAPAIPAVSSAAEEGSPQTPNRPVQKLNGQKPVKVPEILVKDVRQRDNDTQSYIAEEASTATRTDTPLIQVPQSVGVVTQRVIEDQRAVRLEQALRNVSGVAIGQSDEGELATDAVFCRGFPCTHFKNSLRNENGQQASSFRDIANIQRLEVLKGPASVLYGRNEPGGIINILTKQPQAERYHSINQIIGSYNFYRTMFDSTGPLDKDGKFLYRINGAYENKESFRDIVNGQRYFIAPVFTWLAGNNTTITIEGEYLHHRQTFDPGLPAIGTGVAPVPRSRFLGEPFNLSHTEEGRVSLTVAHRFSDSWRIESRFRADETTILGKVAFSDTLQPDNRTLSRFFFHLFPDTSSYFWRNDLIGKVSTGPVKHQLLTGVEIGRQSTSFDFAFAPFPSIDIFNPRYNQAPAPDLPLTRASRVFANSVGAYVQDEVALLDNLRVLFGARGDYFYQNTNVADVVTKAEDFAFSPRIGVSYQPIPQVALYSNVTRSFQPVFSPFAAASNIFKPTTATQYEAGIKTDIVPGRLTSTLAIYRILKEDALAVDPANPFLFVQTGAQRSQGIELDIAAQLMPGWRVIATYAYTDARVVADTTIPVGNRLPLIARHTGSLWSTYDFQSGPLQGFGVGGGLFAVGERAGDINNSFELPGYVRTDAALYYRKPEFFSHTNLVAQLNFLNILNQEYFFGGQQSRGAAAFPGAPLSVIGSVKLEFN